MFQEATDRRVERFTESISFDRRLYAHDIAGSIAHAQMLAAVGLLTATECQLIESTLLAIRQEIEDGRFEYQVGLEDIHMHIEQELIGRLGDVGRKLHTGRSRNDQVSTDLRLWVRDALDRVDQAVVQLQKGMSSCRRTLIFSGRNRYWRATIGWRTAKNSNATASGWPIVGRG